MTNVDYARWGITYLATDSRLSEEERGELVMQATVMYLLKKRKRIVKGESYEGFIETEGEHQLLGTFSGQRFSARLDTDHGKAKLEFLVAERINPALN